MKVIFLDIDGVLNSDEYFEREGERAQTICDNGDNTQINCIDASALDLLVNWLENHKDVKIIISSSWRWDTYAYTIYYFKNHIDGDITSLIPYIYGITPRLNYQANQPISFWKQRGFEIKEFLRLMTSKDKKDLIIKNGLISNKLSDIETYAILDDDTDMLNEQMCVFVHVDRKYGLTKGDLNKVEQILYEK